MSRRTPVPRRTRFAVLERDGFACQYCGAKAPDVVLHVDHVIPVSAGGKDHMDNLVTACEDCNIGKSDTLLSDSPEHVQAAAEDAFDRAQLVKSLVVGARNKSVVCGEPIDAPKSVVEMIESDAQALAVSVAASNSTQAFVAEAVGVSTSYMSTMCSGKRQIPERLVAPFCAAIGSNLLRQYRDLQAATSDDVSEVSRLAALLRSAA